jgi:hypothetical protein
VTETVASSVHEPSEGDVLDLGEDLALEGTGVNDDGIGVSQRWLLWPGGGASSALGFVRGCVRELWRGEPGRQEVLHRMRHAARRCVPLLRRRYHRK